MTRYGPGSEFTNRPPSSARSAASKDGRRQRALIGKSAAMPLQERGEHSGA